MSAASAVTEAPSRAEILRLIHEQAQRNKVTFPVNGTHLSAVTGVRIGIVYTDLKNGSLKGEDISQARDVSPKWSITAESAADWLLAYPRRLRKFLRLSNPSN